MTKEKALSTSSNIPTIDIGYVECKNGDITPIKANVVRDEVPTLDIEGIAFHESYYSTRGNTYDAPTLVAFAKHKNYKTFDLPLVGIDISHMPFSTTTFGQFLYHLKRVNDTNLDYPVILDDEGVICDGWHRVAKAYLEGRPTVKAIRLLEMPDASGKVDSK